MQDGANGASDRTRERNSLPVLRGDLMRAVDVPHCQGMLVYQAGSVGRDQPQADDVRRYQRRVPLSYYVITAAGTIAQSGGWLDRSRNCRSYGTLRRDINSPAL